MFSVDEIQTLLDVLGKQNLVLIGKQLGPSYLTQDEIHKLQSYGVNPFHFYTPENDILQTSFHFGIISDAIGKIDANKLDYKALKEYIESGQYIPLTEKEKYTLDSIKRQTLKDIKANEGRIFSDINNIIQKKEKDNRKAYEKVIRDEVAKGIEKKKTVKQIASEIARKTGDWNRNFERIVHYMSHQAFDEGRAAYYERLHGEEVLVYKDVYVGACSHCVNLYLTKGIGSRPIIFKLSTLKENGTNIGRKQNEWKPIIGPVHPYCRCTLNVFDVSKEWSVKEKKFILSLEKYKEQRKIERKHVRIKINGKEYSV